MGYRLIAIGLLLTLSRSCLAQSEDPSKVLPAGQQARLTRLLQLGDNVIDWYRHAATASDANKDALSEEMRRLALRLATSNSWRSSDFHVSVFVSMRGRPGRVLIEGRPWKTGPSDWDRIVEKTIDAAALPKLNSALKERSEFLTRESVEGHLGLIGKLIKLSPSDLTILRQRITKGRSAQILNRPLCVSSLRDMHLLDDAVIRKTLGERGPEFVRATYNGDNKPQTVRAQIQILKESTEDQIEESVRDAMDKARAGYARRHEEHIKLLAERHRLNSKQKRRLELAAKGIRTRAMATLRQELRKEIAREQKYLAEPDAALNGFGNDIAFASARINAEPLSDQRLWRKTLIEVLSAMDTETTTVPTSFNHKAFVSQMLVALDHELWLRPEQREPLRKRISLGIVKPKVAQTDIEFADQLYRLVLHPAFKDIDSILTPTQLRVFKYLQNPVQKF